MYHKLTIKSFSVTWKQFLELYELDKEPMLYQHITNALFEMRIKYHHDACSKVNTITCLTFEEANAVRYVGGQVAYSLKKQQQKYDNIFSTLEELTDKSPRSSQEN